MKPKEDLWRDRSVAFNWPASEVLSHVASDVRTTLVPLAILSAGEDDVEILPATISGRTDASPTDEYRFTLYCRAESKIRLEIVDPLGKTRVRQTRYAQATELVAIAFDARNWIRGMGRVIVEGETVRSKTPFRTTIRFLHQPSRGTS